jgi:U3 small nucleolar RNA-associated protein 7
MDDSAPSLIFSDVQSVGSRPKQSSKRPRSAENEGSSQFPKMSALKNNHTRGESIPIGEISNKKLQSSLKRMDVNVRNAISQNAVADSVLLKEQGGYLEAENEMEKTFRMKQRDIHDAVDLNVSNRAINLTLDTYGPYVLDYSRNGRYMLLGGAKGHVAVVDWNTISVYTEFHVNEAIHDIAFLHTSQLFAVAQKKYAYIYDSTGAEVHVLKHHIQPLALSFLPHHFLLASIGNAGFLKFQDVSTGELVSQHKTRECGNPTRVLRQNPWNGIHCLGHGNGVVSMWSPNMQTPVVKMLTHRGSLTALAVDVGGRYLTTSGLDSRLKVWDIRMFRDDPVFNYFMPSPATSIDISHRGLTAVTYGSHVQIWGKDFALEALPVLQNGQALADASMAEVSKASAPYMRHELPGKMTQRIRFRPFDDIAAVGHSLGVSSLIIPGAGELHYDSRSADPFASKKAVREGEVHALLDKLPPSSISLDPSAIGRVDNVSASQRAAEAMKAAEEALQAKRAGKVLDTSKLSKSKRRRLSKKSNVVTEQRAALAEKRLAEKMAERQARNRVEAFDNEFEDSSALSRFYNKK